MIMMPIRLIIVSDVADGKTHGAATRIRAKASHGASGTRRAVMTRAFP